MTWNGVAGKRVVITGATAGIGLSAARELARRGAQLSIIARDPDRGQEACRRIGGSVDLFLADLSSQGSMRGLASDLVSKYERIDVLVNNAGAVNVDRRMTADGVELTWAVNHLAPFLLTNLLAGKLTASAPSRIVTTASEAHRSAHIPFDDLAGESGYGPFGFGRYGQTKLANILFTRELAQRLAGTGVEAFCFHPGFVASHFNRNNGRLLALAMALSRPFARSVEKGAETLIWLADSPEPEGKSGMYFFDRRPLSPSVEAQDEDSARRLWQISERQVAP